MTFALPQLLWLLALPAALLAWELLRRRRYAGVEHPKILRAEAGLRTVSLAPQDAAPAALSRRRILLCAGLALGIVALARPQWGKLDEQVFDQSREIIIAIDLSRSMTTPDVKPTRLERAKLLVQSLLDRLHGERVGLIVFSGTAFLQSPASADYEILREFLPALGPDYLPEGGTNYHQLIETATEAFGSGSAADRYLIILSDGEATDDDWKDEVPGLVRKGVRVIGLGVGTAHGGMIPDGSGGFMKDENGAVVMSKLESGTLRDLAAATHGAYRDASEWVDLPSLLSSTVDAGRKGRFVEQNTVRYVERYQWALAQALICLAASFLLEFPVQPKAREIRLSAPEAARPRGTRAAAAAVLAALALALPGAPARAADQGAPPDPAASLSKVVGRLSSQDQVSAIDWAEMASETLTWGQHVGSGGQQVPEPPVRDALSAVDQGSRMDPKAADWPRLKSELEKLLEKQDQQKQDQKQDQDKKQQDQKDQQQQNQGKDQNQDQKQGQGKDQQDQKQGSQPQSSKPQDSRDQGGQQQNQEAGRPKDEKAFGDMNKRQEQPAQDQPRQEPMQKVGGVRKDQQNDPAMKDPGVAVSLEKLEQVKNGDSPAELFDMMRRSEPNPPAKPTGKPW